MRKAALLSLILLGLPAAAAAKTPVVVELYTAQGCGACGEANVYASKLAERPGVLVLTFPVDYWDYLGWADTFAKPVFADRQKAYVAKLSLREPYTPQVVVDGRMQASGARPDRIDRLVKDAPKASPNPPWAPAARRRAGPTSGSSATTRANRTSPSRPATTRARPSSRRTWCAR